MALYLSPLDHAFASGPAFRRPATLAAAATDAGGEEAGQLLMDVFERFHAGAEIGEGLRLSLTARLVSKNRRPTVKIGDDCVVRGILRCERDGELEVGSLVYIGDGVIISAQERIVIGDGTLLAHGVQLFDNDSHPLDPIERQNHFRSIVGYRVDSLPSVASAPVVIGARSWLGFNSVVMKGVTIGDEAVVAACSVVTRDVPPRSVVAGNPARVVRWLDARPEAVEPGRKGVFQHVRNVLRRLNN